MPEERTRKGDYVVIYARVSSSENKSNLDSQAERLTQYAIARGYQIKEVVKEIGSGVNDNRPKLQKILREEKATKIYQEHVASWDNDFIVGDVLICQNNQIS